MLICAYVVQHTHWNTAHNYPPTFSSWAEVSCISNIVVLIAKMISWRNVRTMIEIKGKDNVNPLDGRASQINTKASVLSSPKDQRNRVNSMIICRISIQVIDLLSLLSTPFFLTLFIMIQVGSFRVRVRLDASCFLFGHWAWSHYFSTPKQKQKCSHSINSWLVWFSYQARPRETISFSFESWLRSLTGALLENNIYQRNLLTNKYHYCIKTIFLCNSRWLYCWKKPALS